MNEQISRTDFVELDDVDRRGKLAALSDGELRNAYTRLLAPSIDERLWLPLIIRELKRRDLDIGI